MTFEQFSFLWRRCKLNYFMYLQMVCFSLGTIVARRTVIILITISYYFMYLRTVCFSLGTTVARRKHSYSFHKFNKMFQFMNSLYSRHIPYVKHRSSKVNYSNWNSLHVLYMYLYSTFVRMFLKLLMWLCYFCDKVQFLQKDVFTVLKCQ